MLTFLSPRLVALLFCYARLPVQAHAEQRTTSCSGAVIAKLRQQQALLEKLQSKMALQRDASNAPILSQTSEQASLRQQHESALSLLLSPDTLPCLSYIVKLDAQSKHLLRGTSQLTHVLIAPDRLVLLSRRPSQTSHPEGYCGAGSEDHLILLRYTRGQLVLLDEFLLQSCLKSITLNSDHGDDVIAALTIDREHLTLAFQWLGIPDDLPHRLTVSQGKFILDPQQ